MLKVIRLSACFSRPLACGLLTAGVLLAMPDSGRAAVFTLYVDNTPPPANDYANAVTTISGAQFFSILTPNNSGAGSAFATPSIVRFGHLDTFGGPRGTGTFNTTAAFTFDISSGNYNGSSAPVTPYDHFLVAGTVQGTAGYDAFNRPFSTASYVVTSLRDTTSGQSGSLKINPVTGQSAYFIQATIGGVGCDIYVSAGTSIPAPANGGLDLTGYITTSPVLPTVSGKITLAGIAAGAPAQTITFQFRDTTGTTLQFTKTAAIAPDGAYTLTGIAAGKYNVRIKGATSLAKVIAVDTTGGNAVNANATLSGGDADGNNTVDIADFGILVNAYGGQSGAAGSNYDVRADFNLDGIVDIGDFGALVNVYGQTGDN